MVITGEVLIDLSFPAAQARLADLAYASLVRAIEGACGDGLAGLTRVGPLGAAPGMSKLVDAHILKLTTGDDATVLTVRWEATGPAGALFPALDADITLAPASQDATKLSLAGTYRPPFAALGAGLDKAVLHRAATATIRSFLNRLAAALTDSQTAANVARGAEAPPQS